MTKSELKGACPRTAVTVHALVSSDGVGAQDGREVVEAAARLPVTGFDDEQNRFNEAVAEGTARAEVQLLQGQR
ncbi:MAG: hypothetical protein IT427_09280 [Pirellulales bacterium]|nr:hypothetical protein [Pirellulales bacterium]